MFLLSLTLSTVEKTSLSSHLEKLLPSGVLVCPEPRGFGRSACAPAPLGVRGEWGGGPARLAAALLPSECGQRRQSPSARVIISLCTANNYLLAAVALSKHLP